MVAKCKVGADLLKHSTVAIKAPLPWLQKASAELEQVLDNAIPSTVKNFELNGQELDGQSIDLTVGGMAIACLRRC